MIKILSVIRSKLHVNLFLVIIPDSDADELRKIAEDRYMLFPPFATILSPSSSNGDRTTTYYLYDYELAILFPATLRRIS